MRYIICIVASLLLSSAANAQENKWIPLFGEDLTDATFDPEAWKMTGQVLTATLDAPIWTNTEYEDFELDLDFKNDSGTNSGIIIYCTHRGEWIPNSVEIQIADDYYTKWADAKSYERCGAIYGHLGPTRDKVVKKNGEWNHMRVRCVGQRITVILNGKKVTEMDMALWTSGTENPDGTEIPAWLPNPLAELPTKGFIGLQGKHGEAGISFKNVKIRSAHKTGFPQEATDEEPIEEPNE
ncbi:DUF1080 domain-containing protein [Parabacteroides sp. PF5-6]|uniref:3-keto-disaccharide hydrolase n=1 Tax=Parabacteroides sp. PF5-6 TaxID=1742403 RepID=UPI0024060482|nr:DUF1080 domain-containing protein [Parabacteroides sp. PF5-6]MDF9828919.1 hypothetical protein [Parabacteroides sp. PF5-6]